MEGKLNKAKRKEITEKQKGEDEVLGVICNLISLTTVNRNHN